MSGFFCGKMRLGKHGRSGGGRGREDTHLLDVVSDCKNGGGAVNTEEGEELRDGQ